MCNFLSGLTFAPSLVSQFGACYADPRNTDSHSEMEAKLGLTDRREDPLWAKWEYVPTGELDEFDSYSFRLDEARKPSWWNSTVEAMTIEFARAELARVVIVEDGRYEVTGAERIFVFASAATVEARGSSQPTVEARGSSQPTVVAWDSSQPRVEARGSSQPTVEARGSSQPTVVAWDSSQPRVVARGSSQPTVVAWDSSQPRVVAWDSSQPTVVAWDSSQPRVVARDSSQPRVVARDSSQPRVVARDSSQPRVVARDSSQPTVEARGSSTILSFGNRLKAHTTHELALLIDRTGGTPVVHGTYEAGQAEASR
jgi:hypothetical protein